MRKIVSTLSVFLLCFMYSFTISGQNKEYSKPEKFPKETIELLKDKFQKEMILDTDTLLTADFKVYHKKTQEKENGFYGIEDRGLMTKYLDYLYAKKIVNDIAIIEVEDDLEQKRNYIFKIEIEINNRPISIKDLEFAYNNWDIK